LTSTEGSNGTFTYSFLLDPCTDPNVTTKPSACAPNVTTTCAAANNTISSYQCGIPGNFSITKINQPTVNGRLTDVGIYAEDDWKPKQNLTISYGIRFEAQNFINSNHDFGPRVSFAYGIPRSNGKSPVTVLRGGYGIFYDRFALTDYLTTLQQNGIVQVPSTYINPGSTCAPGQTQNCGSVTPSRLSITRLGPGTRSSYTLQTAIGFDQQLGRIGTLSVNYLNARGVHEFLKRNFLDTAAAGSPLPVGTPIYDFQFQSGAVYRENQLLINARTTLRHMSLFGFYSLNFADANTTGSGFIPTSNSNTRIDYGRATFANRQFGVFGGSIQLPYAFTASPFIIARSGTPYNITSGLDPNGTSVYNARPYFVNGSSGNCAVAADFSGTNPNNNLTPVPINYCTSQANATVNLRLFRTFGFGERTGGAPQSGDNNRGNRNGGGGGRGAGGGGGGGRGPGGMGGGPMGMGGGSSGHRYTLTLGAQASNLFNIVNYASPTSSLTSPRFGQVTTLQTQPFSNNGTAVRTITLQASFNF
jgi:hypothetical protein